MLTCKSLTHFSNARSHFKCNTFGLSLYISLHCYASLFLSLPLSLILSLPQSVSVCLSVCLSVSLTATRTPPLLFASFPQALEPILIDRRFIVLDRKRLRLSEVAQCKFTTTITLTNDKHWPYKGPTVVSFNYCDTHALIYDAILSNGGK